MWRILHRGPAFWGRRKHSLSYVGGKTESVLSSSDHLIHHPVILASRYGRALRKHLFLQCKANYGDIISKSSLGKADQFLPRRGIRASLLEATISLYLCKYRS